MKPIFIFFLLICTSFLSAQISIQDTLSGGEINLRGSAKIDSLVRKTVAVSCYKPPVKKVEVKDTNNYDPCANNPKVMGYKIQIMYSKDRDLARSTSRVFANQFPYLVPEMVYTRPDYRVMAGDYFTKRSAAVDLSKVKKKYPGAFLVQWRVWCRKAK